MQTKTTWTHFLHIGISALIILFTNSCDEGEVSYLLTTNFSYENMTSEQVKIILYDTNGINFKTYSIETNKEVSVSLTQEGDKTGLGQPFAFGNSTDKVATKAIIQFESSNKCLIFVEGKGILFVKDYDNFSENLYNISNNTLIYNIDNTELSNATTCL